MQEAMIDGPNEFKIFRRIDGPSELGMTTVFVLSNGQQMKPLGVLIKKRRHMNTFVR